MPAENCYPLPEGFSPRRAPCWSLWASPSTPWTWPICKAGQTVAVLGAGPIGLLIAAVARAAGASEIYMTEPLAHRRQFALEYIADAVLNPDDADIVAEIKRLTGGRGVDVAFEAAGATETPQQAAAVTRIGGKVIVAGIPSDDTMIMNASTVRHKGLDHQDGASHEAHLSSRHPPGGERHGGRQASGHSPFPLERIGEAFELVASYGDGVLRAMIQISD